MSGDVRVTCPVCGREVVAKGGKIRPPFPFCSQRCRMIDLRRWLGEEYRLRGAGAEEAEDEWQEEDTDRTGDVRRAAGDR